MIRMFGKNKHPGAAVVFVRDAEVVTAALRRALAGITGSLSSPQTLLLGRYDTAGPLRLVACTAPHRCAQPTDARSPIASAPAVGPSVARPPLERAMPSAASGPACAQIRRGHEDASEGLQGAGVRARLAGLRTGQHGDRDDDGLGDVDERLGHPRFDAGELAGGTGVVGLDGRRKLRAPRAACGVSGASGVVSGMSAPRLRSVLLRGAAVLHAAHPRATPAGRRVGCAVLRVADVAVQAAAAPGVT